MRPEVREVLSSRENVLSNSVICGKKRKVFFHDLISHTADSNLVDQKSLQVFFVLCLRGSYSLNHREEWRHVRIYIKCVCLIYKPTCCEFMTPY